MPYLHLKPFRGTDLDGVVLRRPVYGVNSPTYTSRNYSVPVLFEELATLYVTEVRKVEPHGPYLPGGGSFGGMLAVKMAEALLAQGDKVLRVIMLDSGNPKLFPPFKLETEHKALTETTYKQIVAISTALCVGGKNGAGVTSSTSQSSSESEDEENDEIDLGDVRYVAKLTRRYISAAFLVLSNQGQRGFLAGNLDTHVVLIKCKTALQIGNIPLLNRSAYMLGVMRDQYMESGHFKV